jgi:pre-mRNA-splicing factor CDC5/CEF1
MKYGLNQWARISSLLVRKSPKQCKARWYDWLDPSIKKTEWTREEDEKLLHLAKLLPTQWRTIAPVVGRTPAQCLERYERLLDLAVGGGGADGGDGAGGSRRGADDPRRLRPGEIDPHPEAKPARPDAVDMDEDEREMLAEARARLANTRGKKAKRKAREKALEEARRLASLQKARELKAAGLEAAQAKAGRARGGISGSVDHNAEVAFERRAPLGLHDTRAEDLRAREMAREFRPVSVEELEGRRRRDAEEESAQRDLKRQKLADERDARALAARVNEGGGGAALLEGRRGRMMLPAPQVGDAEMDAIARMAARGGGDGVEGGAEGGGAAGLLAGGGGGGGGGVAGGGGLSAFFGPGGAAGSLRTPRAEGEGGRDALLVQARNLAVSRGMQTPLVGGDNPDELRQLREGAGGGGALPAGRAAVAATPNPLAAAAAPFASAARGGRPGLAPSSVRGGPGWGGGGASALRGGAGGGVAVAPGAAMPLLAAPRDALGLNDAEALAAAGGGGLMMAPPGAVRSDLRAGFASLPAPANEYALAVPDEEDEEDGATADGDAAMTMEEDAEEVEARARREAEARRARELLRRSAAVRRGLPRPTAAAVEAASAPHAPHRRRAAGGKGAKDEDEEEEEADGAPPADVPRADEAAALVAAEYDALVAHDALAFPVGRDGVEQDRRAATAVAPPEPAPGPPIPLEALRAAAALVADEAAQNGAAGPPPERVAAALALADARLGPLLWIPSRAAFVSEADLLHNSSNKQLAAEALRAAFEATRLEMEREAHRAAKLERRAAAAASAPQARAEADARAARQSWEAAAKARSDVACFAALLEQEQRAAPDRIGEARERLARAARREAALQRRYARLRSARDELAAAAAAAGGGGE